MVQPTFLHWVTLPWYNFWLQFWGQGTFQLVFPSVACPLSYRISPPILSAYIRWKGEVSNNGNWAHLSIKITETEMFARKCSLICWFLTVWFAQTKLSSMKIHLQISTMARRGENQEEVGGNGILNCEGERQFGHLRRNESLPCQLDNTKLRRIGSEVQ